MPEMMAMCLLLALKSSSRVSKQPSMKTSYRGSPGSAKHPSKDPTPCDVKIEFFDRCWKCKLIFPLHISNQGSDLGFESVSSMSLEQVG